MKVRPLFGLLAVLLAGHFYLTWFLEGPSKPLGPLLALLLLLGPGLGFGLARRQPTPGGWPVLLAASFGLSNFLLAGAILLFGFRLAVLVPMLLGLGAAGFWLGRRYPGSTESDGWGLEGVAESDAQRSWFFWASAAACGALVLVPFGEIGRLTPDGFAYRTFFDHDFLVHLSVVTELEKGQFPPSNPYYGGATLHYYWLYFLYPALADKLGGGLSSTPNTLTFCNFASVLGFAAVFYGLLLELTGRARWAFVVLVGAILCGSFEGAFVLERIRQGYLPRSPWDYNVDAVTRWYIIAPQIDALLRGLLYTPQHLWSLSFLLGLGHILRRRVTRSVAGWVFVLLLPMLGFSGFIGGIAFCWVLSLVFLDLTGTRGRRWAGLLIGALAAAVVGGLLYRSLGMFRSGGFVQVVARPNVWKNLLELTVLNFGGLGLIGLLAAGLTVRLRSRVSIALLALGALVLGLIWSAACDGHFQGGLGRTTLLFLLGLVAAVASLLVAVEERSPGGRDYLTLGALGMTAIFTGFIPGYINEFGLRGGFVVALSAATTIALLIRRATEWHLRSRLALGLLALVLGLLSLPTPIIDLHNARNLLDPRFITYLSPREAEALDWIRQNVPERSVVQGLPDREQGGRDKKAGRGSIGNFINALGQRRMAVGKTYYAGQFQIGEDEARARVQAVSRVFRSATPQERLKTLLEQGIDYLLVGPDERWTRHADPDFFATQPGLFQPVFDNEEFVLYRVDLEAVRNAWAALPPQPEESPE